MKIKRSNSLAAYVNGENIFDFANIVFILFFLAIIIFPLWNIVALSFNDGNDAMRGGIYLWPRKFSLENYRTILKNAAIYNAFMVSGAKTIVGIACHLFITGIAGYAMSKPYLMGRKVIIKMGVITMYFSGGLIPMFLLIKNLGLSNSFWVYIIPCMFSFYDMIIMMNFFRDIPVSLEESATIDGANYFQVFFRIILPLSMPVMSTIALFHGVYQWNDFFTAKLYITSEGLFPIQFYLYRLLTNSAAMTSAKAGVYIAREYTTQSLQQATMIITTLPIILVYPFLQKYFIKGMLVGGVKE